MLQIFFFKANISKFVKILNTELWKHHLTSSLSGAAPGGM